MRGNSFRRPAILLLVLLALTASKAAGQLGPEPGRAERGQINNDLRTAASLVKAGEYSRAINFLDRMRSNYGDDSRIDDLYKQIYKQAKLYPELENLIRSQLAKDPRNPLLLTELGEAKFLQNDEAQAESLWTQALEAGRDDQLTYRMVAETKLKYGLYDAAIEVYLQGRKNLGSSTLFAMELASIYEILRDYPKAVDEYLLQIADNPGSLGLISTKIRGLIEDADDPQSIVKAVSARIKEAPGRLELYEILGDLYIKLNEMDKALEAYRSIGVRQDDDGQSLVRFADKALQSKAYLTSIRAVDGYLKATKKGTMREMAQVIKAKSLLASGQVNAALQGFSGLSSTAMDYRIRDEAAYSCGLIYADYKNSCDSALFYWRNLLSRMKDPVLTNQTRLGMAVCYLKQDRYDDAESLLVKAASGNAIDSTVERALFLLGDLSLYRGDFKVAGDRYKQLVVRYPQGDYSNDALMRMDVLSSAGSDSGESAPLRRFAEAMKAMTLGRPQVAALVLSDSTLASSPIAEQAAFYCGISYSQAGSKKSAIDALNAYIEKYPDGLYTDRAYLELGDLFAQDTATLWEAKAAYNKILEAFPDGPVSEPARQRLRSIEKLEKIG